MKQRWVRRWIKKLKRVRMARLASGKSVLETGKSGHGDIGTMKTRGEGGDTGQEVDRGTAVRDVATDRVLVKGGKTGTKTARDAGGGREAANTGVGTTVTREGEMTTADAHVRAPETTIADVAPALLTKDMRGEKALESFIST